MHGKWQNRSLDELEHSIKPQKGVSMDSKTIVHLFKIQARVQKIQEELERLMWEINVLLPRTQEAMVSPEGPQEEPDEVSELEK